MNFATVACKKTHAFAAVVRTAAAKRNDTVAFFFFIYTKGLSNVVVGGVWNGLVIYGVLHFCSIKDVGDLLEYAGVDNAWVGNKQGFDAANIFQTIRNFFGTPLADESDVGNKKGGDLSHMHPLKLRTHS
ncbi:hypothetical protein SDC9_70734 [bioreactor metagenome]|uniref:Uncharacterized protein n=1 Tax=bioreactor metagenome TaxID=1076179 RepID=A0A644YCJ3_9ZZZZ